MADKKISQLTALSAANVASATDVLAIVDTSATETKKITAKDLIDGALNGGTANGVLYLNGSKVATSGSALTFDGTTVLTTPRINVTNTAIGATFSSSGGSGMRLYGSSGTNQWDIYLNGANVRFSDNTGGGVVKIDTGAVIDGNLGLGVTPSAWSGIGKTLQINTGGSFSADSANAYFAANCYYNGTNWIYQTTNNATRYTMANNSHQWYIAPSGTAGNPITFTQAMTLDASGNLLVGQTSWNFSNNGTQIAASGRIFNTSSTDYNMELAGGQSGRVRFYTSSGGSGTTVGSITVDTTNTQYNTSSDRRLKHNIVPAAEAGAVIDGIEVVEFDWKSGAHTRYGMIAQNLHKVVPEAVSVGDADDVEDFKNPWGVDYSKLVPMLVKELQSVRARLAALEAK